MSLPLFIAKKFRNGRKNNGMLSLVSIISMLNIAIGIAALIVGLSAMNGFEKELKNRVLSVIPHGEVYTSSGSLPNWRMIKKEIDSQKQITASAPFVNFTALLENGKKVKAVQIQGIDVIFESKMSHISDYISMNEWKNFNQNEQQILIGKGLAESLNAKTGDKIIILIPQSDEYGQLKQPKRISVSVAGILDFSGQLGNQVGIIKLADAQNYLQLGDNVTGIKMNVVDLYKAKELIYDAVSSLYYPLNISSWEDNYRYMYHDILMIRQIMYLAMIIVISVACFSIVSTLIIAVKDKQKEIAILKTLGAPKKLIIRIFILYGLISGLIGSLFGITLGIILSINLSNIIKFIELILDHQLLNSHIYFIDFIPSELHFSDVILVFFTSLTLTLLASYYPARRACKIEPVKIINNS